MEKIIFFTLVLLILGFVLYLGITAIMKGFKAKQANKSFKTEEYENINLSTKRNQLSEEIKKLNELLKSGVLTQEEFEKAKNKILDN
tara:strand:- start:311 stop:571 length:261 start_codon:yes stop_codon:yes gene_type:complete